MRIAFIASSLEPDRDGVGDYTRHLAAECIRQGHESIILGLNDTAVLGRLFESQESEGTPVSVQRLSAALPWSERAALARMWLDDFNPDWVSLQFVCFGFHPKGLPWRLAKPLKHIIDGKPVQFMFHELWVGCRAKAKLKLRVWGALQRWVVLDCHRGLRPCVTQTSNTTLAKLLSRHGIEAKILPLFSHIPVRAPSGWLDSELIRLQIKRDEGHPWVLLGIFGAIHAEWSANGWLDYLVDRAAGQGKRVALLGIGKVSPVALERFRTACQRDQRVFGYHFGPQSAERISDFLHLIDIGLPTIEHSFLGKSSGAAAMAEHGVPLLVTRIDDEADRANAQLRILRDIDHFLAQAGQPRIAGPTLLKSAAKSMLVELCMESRNRCE